VNPDPFSIDTYAGCENECEYCFSLGKDSSFFPHRSSVESMSFNEIQSQLTGITSKGKQLDNKNKRYRTFKWGFEHCTYSIGARYDPMPSIEKEYKTTLKTLKLFKDKYILLRSKNPHRIIGEYLNTGAKLMVCVSVSSADNKLEKKSISFSERLAEVKRLSSVGVPVLVNIYPACPWTITDDVMLSIISSGAKKIFIGGFEARSPEGVKKWAYNWSPQLYYQWALRMKEIASNSCVPVYFLEPWLRDKGCKSPFPCDQAPLWNGTIFDNPPVLPGEIEIHPIKKGVGYIPIKESYKSKRDYWLRRIKMWDKWREKVKFTSFVEDKWIKGGRYVDYTQGVFTKEW